MKYFLSGVIMAAAAAAVMLSAFPAFAEDIDHAPRSIQRQHERRAAEMLPLDTNQNGLLEVTELLDSVGVKFDAADTDRNAVLSPAEIQALLDAFIKREQPTYGTLTARKARDLSNRFNSADTNRDGQLTRAEYNAYFSARYRKYDRDGDGIVTQTEYRMDVESLPNAYSRPQED